MTQTVDAEQVRAWIDDDLVGSVEHVPDDAAVFNLLIEISNIRVHVIRREEGGPLLVGQQIAYGTDIRTRLQQMAASDRNDLVARIRETLTAVPVVYGFHDEHGANVRFAELSRIFVERRLYPGTSSQQTLMDALVDVWKVIRYLDDIVTLIESAES